MDFMVGLTSGFSSQVLIIRACHFSLVSLTSSATSSSLSCSRSLKCRRGLNSGLSFPDLILSIISRINLIYSILMYNIAQIDYTLPLSFNTV